MNPQFTEGTDITARLTTWCHAPQAESAQDLMDEAAKEIERLRSEIARLRLADDELDAIGLNDPIHSQITVTILDAVTGETRVNSQWSPWWWAYGNGSCDCNRGLLFGNDEGCGENRYYIVAVEGDESGYAMDKDYNRLYPAITPNSQK
jgi:hypothetical protein